MIQNSHISVCRQCKTACSRPHPTPSLARSAFTAVFKVSLHDPAASREASSPATCPGAAQPSPTPAAFEDRFRDQFRLDETLEHLFGGLRPWLLPYLSSPSGNIGHGEESWWKTDSVRVPSAAVVEFVVSRLVHHVVVHLDGGGEEEPEEKCRRKRNQ